MEYSIAQIQADVEPKLHDSSIDKLTGSFYDKVHQAARKILLKIDPFETMRTIPLGSLSLTTDYMYQAPVDLKGNKIVAVLPTDLTEGFIGYTNRGFRDFTFDKEYGDINIRVVDRVKNIYFVGYNGTQANPGDYSVLYYSNCMFVSEDGVTLKKKPTLNTDLIIAEDGLYEILLNELAFICAHELQSEESNFDISFYNREIKNAYENYSGDNKSQAEKPRNSYYKKGGRGHHWKSNLN